MVEVVGKREQLRISVWKFLLFLFLLLTLLLMVMYFLLASNFGASNSLMETIRRYLRFTGAFHPNLKPEDNFDYALRIHGVEKAGPKRFYMFVSVTGKNAAPAKVIQNTNVKLTAKDNSGKDLNVAVNSVRPLHMYSDWSDPLSFANVMDYSASMFPEDLEAIESNFSTLVNELIMPFAAAVIKFNDSVWEILDLSTDKNAVINAIKKAIPLQNTALFDGIVKGVEKVQNCPHLRFIVLTTDGNDNASHISLNDVIKKCQQNNVSVFSFGFGWLDIDSLKKLSDETEGYYSYVTDSSNLDDWFKKLGQIINNVQVIEFSTDSDVDRLSFISLTIDHNNKKLSRNRLWL